MSSGASVERFRSTRRRRVGFYLSAVLLAVLVGVGNLVVAPPAPTTRPAPEAEAPGTAADAGRRAGTVTRIVDGDTFHVSFSDTRLRIWGLDAPEVNEPGGSAATEALRRLSEGRLVSCEIHDIDRYGRPVGQCFLPGGRDIAAAMIASGAASEYCHFSRNHYGTC